MTNSQALGSPPPDDVLTVSFIPSAPSLFALLGLELPEVELELFALEDVTVGATDLTGARGNGRQNTTGLELLLQ